MLPPQAGNRRYTLCVPGVGKCSSDAITGLLINNKDLNLLVADALARNHGHSCVWLDIQAPSISDISALTHIFKIDKTTSHELWKLAANSSHKGSMRPPGKQPSPAGRNIPNHGLYLSWAEADINKESINLYCAKGKAVTAVEQPERSEQQKTPGSDSLSSVEGYVPVPPWFKPNASQAINRYSLLKMASNKGEPLLDFDMREVPLEHATQQRAQYLLQILNRPRPELRGIAALRAALKRKKGKGHEPWQGILAKALAKKEPRSPPKPAPDIPPILDETWHAEAVKGPIGHSIVQVWACGPIVLTFHQQHSEAIEHVMDEVMALSNPVLDVGAEAIVQGLVSYWTLATQSCLGILRRYADRLALDLSEPTMQYSTEAQQWVPIIARCRKVALALLRRCRVNETVLSQLCQTATRTEGTEHSSKRQKQWRTLSRTRGFSMADVIGQYKLHRQGVYELQKTQQAGFASSYRLIERRLSILDASLLARQRQRLLFAEKAILRLMTWGMAVELIVTPIEFWHHADNMNGITTPGRLYKEDPARFYWSLLVFSLWAVVATIGYRVYFHHISKRATRKVQWNSQAINVAK
ncbi:hypothetical protein GQ54DRAFT_299354 [Martensiomyces pterosporus]|nr:hypothetical protein GQ54DRAFT_299354 [Martensiomyces pterosporus]